VVQQGFIFRGARVYIQLEGLRQWLTNAIFGELVI
jgi:hypothetical protein